MDDAAKLKAASAASDAAILATPLYRPPSPDVVAPEATPDRPGLAGSNGPAAPDPRAGLPVDTVVDVPSRPAERPAAFPSKPDRPDDEPIAGRPGSGDGTDAPSTRSAEAPATPIETVAPSTATPATQASAGSRVSPAPSSALPVSDLERLDEGRSPEDPAPNPSPPRSRPWTPLLLAGLALVSLLGVRWRR